MCNYVEQLANWDIPFSQAILDKTIDKYGFHPTLYRAAFRIALSESLDKARDLVNKVNAQDMYILLALFLLESNQEEEALKYLHLAGKRGEIVLTILSIERTNSDWSADINLLLRDLVSAKADNLLSRWLPHANEHLTIISFLRYTPFKEKLELIDWLGENEVECDYLSLRNFHERNFEKALHWIERGMSFPPTVTKFLLLADLALLDQDVETAKKYVFYGKQLFSASILLDQVEKQLGAFTPKLLRLEDLLMNPADIYRNRAIQTMPLHIQLAQLHLRAATLVKQVKEDYSQARIQEGRANIEEIQNIITFLRSSLDPKLEVSAITDQTYAFFYKITVQWFIQPNSIDEDFEAMLNFWESWADTWTKVKPSTTT
jgi:flagellin-specific chaperone FliS